jgi:hypothetical protein
MNEAEFRRELESAGRLKRGQIIEKLELLVNAPNTPEGYTLAFAGFLHLVHIGKVKKTNRTLRRAVYTKIIKILEEDPDPKDREALNVQIDYAVSILSHFMVPPVPQKYVDQIREAGKGYCQRRGEDSGTLKRWLVRLPS